MALQFADTFDNPSESTARVYIPADVVTDSAFPFDPGEVFVLRTVRHEGFVVTRPDCPLETIDLPPINEDIL